MGKRRNDHLVGAVGYEMNLTAARKIVAKKLNIGRRIWLMSDKQIWAIYYRRK